MAINNKKLLIVHSSSKCIHIVVFIILFKTASTSLSDNCNDVLLHRSRRQLLYPNVTLLQVSYLYYITCIIEIWNS